MKLDAAASFPRSKRSFFRFVWRIALAMLAAEASAPGAQPATIAATLPPAAQLARELAPAEARIVCLIAGTDPHLAQLTPSAARRARSAEQLIALGAIDAGWRPAHPQTIVLFPHDAHGWLDPARIPSALDRLAKAWHRSAPSIVADEQARWRALLRRHQVQAVILQHEAWRAWFAALGVQILAVLDAHGTNTHSAKMLSQALARARAYEGHLLLVGEPNRPMQVLQWLRRHLAPKPPLALLDPIGRCDQSWRQHMQRARAFLIRALGASDG